MHFCPYWAKAEGDTSRLNRPLPAALAYGKPALLSKQLREAGAVLLPSMLRCLPTIGNPLVLDPENCVLIRDRHADEVVEALPLYNSKLSGPRFTLRYTFVPRCPGKPPPSWVHPSLLEPDPEPDQGLKVNGRVFPLEELYAYCSKGAVNSIKYQAEDNAESTPRVHVVLSKFGKAEEGMMERLVMAHVKARITIDICHVKGGSPWYRFTSCAHRRKGFEKLEVSPRLFTSNSRGGLRAVYERLLRKHVLFYEKMSRGVATLAFNELEREDVAQIWDRYGAKNTMCVRGVNGGRPPLFWADMQYKDREKAKSMLAKMPWKSSVMKPAILSKKTWSKQHTRENARKSTPAGLSIPQVRLCATEEALREETMHYRRYPWDRQPILITDSNDYDDASLYEGVIVLGGSEILVEGNVVRLPLDSCDAKHADLIAQWFPLLRWRCDAVPEGVHSSVVGVAEEYAAICASKARAAAAREQDEDNARDRRKARSEMEEFERLSREYEAIKTFAYPGCNDGFSTGCTKE